MNCRMCITFAIFFFNCLKNVKEHRLLGNELMFPRPGRVEMRRAPLRNSTKIILADGNL